MNVLLVEDNDLNRDMLVRRLARHGVAVHCAVDGEDGVRKAQSLLPDVILMDINLPVIDGWEAIRQIKANPGTQGIPIVALTAHVFHEDRQHAIDLGCAAFVGKPIDMQVLLATLQRIQTGETLA